MHVGAAGNGQRTKLVNNALFVADVGLAIDAVRLAGSLGIDEKAILAAVQHGSGASRGLNILAGMDSVAAVPDRLGEMMSKDVSVVEAVAEPPVSTSGSLAPSCRPKRSPKACWGHLRHRTAWHRPHLGRSRPRPAVAGPSPIFGSVGPFTLMRLASPR